MPVLVEAGDLDRCSDRQASHRHADQLEIGLLNNLSDAGLLGGERQFVSLLEDAALDRVVRLRLYSLPSIVRGAMARERIDALYGDVETMMAGRLDGLIVTGCEPTRTRLPDEPFWPGLTAVIDWAEDNTTSALFSCLAAHAAVLHLDGIERRPLCSKRSGIFSFAAVEEHGLLAGGGPVRRVPHSRLNDVNAGDLTAHGYKVLSRSPSAGVDLFVKQWRSLLVYLQGHPEYDSVALAREFRRDVGRFLTGMTDRFPALPEHYFGPATASALRAFEGLARHEREPGTLDALPLDFAALETRAARWRGDAVRLVRNWLNYLAARNG